MKDNTKTALTRTKEGNLKVFRDNEYKTNKEFEEDLRGNGYKVLKVWNGNKTDSQVDEWELLNRR
jgi:hypothetical protein